MSVVYTSNKREGEPGFAFPEGCPKGRKRAQRVGPRDIPRGRQTQALPTSCWRYFILFHLVLSLDQGRYEIYTVIPSLVTFCWERQGYSYVNSWLLFTKEYEVDKTRLKRMVRSGQLADALPIFARVPSMKPNQKKHVPATTSQLN